MNEEAQAWLLSHLLKFFKGAEQEQTLNHNLLWNIRKQMFYPGEDVRFDEASRPVSSHLHHYIILSFRSFFLNQSYRVFL